MHIHIYTYRASQGWPSNLVTLSKSMGATASHLKSTSFSQAPVGHRWRWRLVYMGVCVCVCVCERGTDRKRQKHAHTYHCRRFCESMAGSQSEE